jgi:hypothetical protein
MVRPEQIAVGFVFIALAITGAGIGSFVYRAFFETDDK